jgi:hypothetical protein
MVQLSKFSIYTLVIALGACEFSTEKKNSDSAPQQRSSEDMKAEDQKAEAAKKQDIRADSLALTDLLDQIAAANPGQRKELIDRLRAFDLSTFGDLKIPGANELSKYFTKNGANELADKLQGMMAGNGRGLKDFIDDMLEDAKKIIDLINENLDIPDGAVVFGPCDDLIETPKNKCSDLESLQAQMEEACNAAGVKPKVTYCDDPISRPEGCPKDGRNDTLCEGADGKTISQPIGMVSCSPVDICKKIKELENKEPAAPN